MFFDSGSNQSNNVTIYPQSQLHRSGYFKTLFDTTLLPYNKGRHPLIWAKVLGLNKSGSTFFFMDEGADTGDILSQKEFMINFEDDASKLYDKLIDTALMQIEEFHLQLKNDNYSKIQQDRTKGNSWRKRGKKDKRRNCQELEIN